MSGVRSKQQWRAEFLARRAETDPTVRRSIVLNTREWVMAERPSCVHGYLAKPGTQEIETRDLLSQLVAIGIQVVVPRILDVVNGIMELVEWKPDMPVRPNRFGIDEPIGGTVVSSMDVDLWIVPLLGADRAGNRLGYGAGYYDRMLRGTPGIKAGLLPESCVVDALPVDPHDIPVDVVITENGVFNSYL